jgi:hypothetical protein
LTLSIVTVNVEGKQLWLVGDISIASDNTEFVALPEDIEVIGPNGKRIPRDKRRVRLITVGTFDPFHGVADVLPELWSWSSR